MVAAETQESADYPSDMDELDTKLMTSTEYDNGIFDEKIHKLF